MQRRHRSRSPFPLPRCACPHCHADVTEHRAVKATFADMNSRLSKHYWRRMLCPFCKETFFAGVPVSSYGSADRYADAVVRTNITANERRAAAIGLMDLSDPTSTAEHVVNPHEITGLAYIETTRQRWAPHLPKTWRLMGVLINDGWDALKYLQHMAADKGLPIPGQTEHTTRAMPTDVTPTPEELWQAIDALP